MTDIPNATWSGVFRVFGVDMRCHVLDDGRRIIEAEDVEKFFAALEDDVSPTSDEKEEFSAFMRWQGGWV